MLETTAWTFPKTDPVVPPGLNHDGLVTTHAGAAHVVKLGETYRMYYWARDRSGGNHIVRADAPVDDPMTWRPVGGSLIGPLPDLPANAGGPGFPHAVHLHDRRVLLYYCAWGIGTGKRLPNTMGLAISDDGGRTFRYHDTHPIMPGDRPYDREATGSLWVTHEHDRLRMWYTAIGRYFDKPPGVQTGHGDRIPEIGIAYAESDDGVSWRKPRGDRVVKPRGFGVAPYEYIVSKPSVLKVGDQYVLWVNTFGTAYRVHRLISPDGIDWRWSPRVGPDGEMGTGAPGAFDDHQRSYPCVVREGDELRAWYTGNGFGRTGMGYARCRIIA